jgi:prophage DNA circulation protein
VSGSVSGWRASLRPASWRGVPFQVSQSEAIAGRRVHVHEYPFRDLPWAEDLGRRTRGIVIRGYLIGDDVADQLQELQDAAEEKGSGQLVHPLRGDLDVTLISLGSSDAWDEGRVVRIIMEFVETGERRFPSSAVDGQADVNAAANALDQTAAESGEKGILERLKEGYEGAQRVAKTVKGYVATARRYVNSTISTVRSVTSVLSLVPGLGKLGRFINRGTGRVSGTIGKVSRATNGVSSALNGINSARANVGRLGNRVASLVDRL